MQSTLTKDGLADPNYGQARRFYVYIEKTRLGDDETASQQLYQSGRYKVLRNQHHGNHRGARGGDLANSIALNVRMLLHLYGLDGKVSIIHSANGYEVVLDDASQESFRAILEENIKPDFLKAQA